MKIKDIIYFLLLTIGILYSIVMLIVAIADNSSDCFYKGFLSMIITGCVLLYSNRKGLV